MSDHHLAPHHMEMLEKSAISPEVAAARGYRTITNESELADLGFAPAQRRVPGLLLPLHLTDGGNGVYTYRPDNPRVLVDKGKREPDGQHHNRVIKYETPKGTAMRLDCPPLALPHLGNPTTPLFITEGQKKGDAILSAAHRAGRPVCVIALLGVFNWRGRNELGGSTVLADWEYVALKGREVRLVFDSDSQTNPNVLAALERLSAMLRNKGAHVSVIYLPGARNGKVGVDDWLAGGHSLEDLERLVQLAQPQPAAAAPTVELLDTAPLELARPLVLVGGRAYAATWLHVRRTITEVLDKKNNRIVKLAHPEVETRHQLFIIRDDGRVFGDGGDEVLESIGLDIQLAEVPPSEKLLTTAGVRKFRSGYRPNPVDVFRQMVDIVQRFIDFERSLASQDVMAEFVACYALSTWFVDAFQVIGFLWPNGDRGSGKTHLLHVVAQMSYLGSVIMSGGSFASLRDLADYGATLAFDDAEELSDPRKSDPDKRALLLAGNRRGAFVTIKEPAPDGRSWRTRYVKAFCPRLFSAIRLPDAVLASRTIIVPLIRTADRNRANSDPLDFTAWPHDRRTLVDDLWMLALSRLVELPAHDAAVGQSAKLTGRNLQPWRAVLAVASWLSANGTPGMMERMEGLAMAYQSERPELETSDWMVLAIRALFRCAVSDVKTVGDIEGKPFREITLKTSTVTDAMKTIAEELEADIDTERITSRSVGRLLAKMRLPKSREAGKGTRGWRVTITELARWATSYAIPLPEELERSLPTGRPTLPASVTDGGNVTNVTAESLLEGET